MILLFSIISCSKTNKEIISKEYSLSGKINNLKDSTLIILKTFNSKTIDSAYSSNNQFKLNFKEDELGLYLLKLKNTKDSAPFYFDFWFEKKNITISGDFKDKENIKIINSSINDFLRDYRNVSKNYNKRIEKAFKKVTDDEKLETIFQKFKDSIENDQIDILFTNPNNLFSINEIIRYKHKITKKRLNNFYKKLNNKIKLSPEGLILKEYLSSNQVTIGEKFLDFETTDLNGNKVKLSDFKGKIILLDFWAYWCTWCHVQNKEEFSFLNEKYKKDWDEDWENHEVINIFGHTDYENVKVGKNYFGIDTGCAYGRKLTAFELGVEFNPDELISEVIDKRDLE